MNALSYIKQLPQTIEQKEIFIKMCINEILDGSEDPILIDAQLKLIQDTIEAIRKDRDIKFNLIDEFSKHGSKSIELNEGLTVTMKSRTIKKYDNCGDAILLELESDKKKLDEMIKARKSMIDTGINPDTGETFNKPVSLVTEFLEYRFK